MKNLKIYIILALGVFMASCSEDDKLTEVIRESTVTRGAILRTIATPSPTFDFNDASQEWAVEVEEQDVEDGALFSEIGIYVTLTAGATGATTEEVFVKSIPASTFSTGPNGLPRGLVSTSLADVLSALSLQTGDFESIDFFNIRLELILTDGRIFTDANTTPAVSGGSFFSSPFTYSAQFFCALADASIFDGNYVVTNDSWADYNPGDVVPVEFVSDFTFRILSTNNPFISNTDTSYIEVTIDPVDGSATMVASNESFNYGPLIDVVGTGSIGTFTGDINLTLDFVGFATNQGFSLIKQ